MNYQNCSEILNLIPSYIDDFLDREEKDRVAEHIKSCANCRAEYELMSSITKKTKKIPDVAVSADFHKNLMAKAKEQKTAKRTRHIVLLRRSGAGVAAAAVVALSVVSFGNLNSSSKDLDNPVYSATPTPESAVVTIEDVATYSDNKQTKAPSKAQQSENALETPKTNITAPVSDDAGGGSAVSPEAPSSQDSNSGIATVCDDLLYTKAVIALDDTNNDAVMKILEQYEKDEIGYRVPDINKVMRKIAELGITVTAENCELSQNYIIVE